jgi:hypothetical protein
MKTAMAVVALMLSLLSRPMSAGAKPVYKCEEGGKITFTDQPCAPGASPVALPQPIITAPPTRSEPELAREHEARLARERAERDRDDARWLQEHAERQERERKPPSRAGKRKQ